MQDCPRGWGRTNTAQSFRHFLSGEGFFHSLPLTWGEEAKLPREAAAVLVLACAWGTLDFSALGSEADPV